MAETKTDKAMVEFEVDGSQVKLTPQIVQEYLTNGVQVSMPEYKMFTELCKVRKLNPFLKEAYIIKFGNNPAQIVVGKEAILKRAVLNEKFNGREQGIIVLKEDGTVEKKSGTFRLPNEELVGGWATVYRKDWDYPVSVTVSFSEVAQTKRDGQLNSQWGKHGATMVEKVALVRALREAFVEDLGGMIEEGEAWNTDDMPRQAQEPVAAQPDPMGEPIEVDIEEA